MIPCICIDNSNCPIDYPLPSQWIEKNKEYHIIDVKYVVKSETLGFKLLEKKSIVTGKLDIAQRSRRLKT